MNEPAASDVRDGINAVEMLQPNESSDREGRRERDVEASVGVEHCRRVLALLEAFLGNEEHGDLGAVLGGVEDLLGLEAAQVDARERRAAEQHWLGRGHVLAWRHLEAIDVARRRERSVLIKKLKNWNGTISYVQPILPKRQRG